MQVGTQVSGQVSAIYVDFNDQVKKGQLSRASIRRCSSRPCEDAQAQLDARAGAAHAGAGANTIATRRCSTQKHRDGREFETAQSNYSVAQATLKSAQIALDKARSRICRYTSIYAPIDGVIVERNVDVGQTVAASLSAPQLFLIANDLSQMQILASVDESDIGQIKDGQPVQLHGAVVSGPARSRAR